jgi:GDPmannose 4,6-dehydratase
MNTLNSTLKKEVETLKASSTVLISGITGQDGSYMAELCLELGHKVFGMVRRTSTINDANYRHLLGNPNFKVVYGDLLDGFSIDSLVRDIQPDYFINFAAQSFVGCSWEIPEETFMAGAVGVLKCLEAIRKNVPFCRFYNAGSSEQFGDVLYSPQDIKHPYRPRSPYGAAKVAAHSLVKVYRESYNLYAIQGVLFNHESERRGEEFVTRKITKGIGRIVRSLRNGESFEPIRLGNLDAKRDWSHSQDFVEGVWRMLNQETYNSAFFDDVLRLRSYTRDGRTVLTPQFVSKLKEYVLSSNETHAVREFINIALYYAKIDGVWSGSGVEETFTTLDDKPVIVIDPKFFRPAEVELLLGDSTPAREELGWKPKISFDNLVKRMVETDLPNEKTHPSSNHN